MPVTITRTTQMERTERRKEMAEKVRDGATVDDIAEEYGVARNTVIATCKVYKVPLPKIVPKAVASILIHYKIIALLLNTTFSPRKIAKLCNSTEDKVKEIIKNCNQVGIAIKRAL